MLRGLGSFWKHQDGWKERERTADTILGSSQGFGGVRRVGRREPSGAIFQDKSLSFEHLI